MRRDPPIHPHQDNLMEINYRPARLEDLPACIDVFQESFSDMLKRHNLPLPQVLGAARRLEVFEHCFSTGIFHVAEARGRIIAFAAAILRDHLWFLSAFWARPRSQQSHVGMQLLRGVWEAGKQSGATTFFVWSSIDLPAMAAYMKLGMLPGSQMLVFEGAPQLKADAAAGYTAEPLRRSAAMKLDELVLGVRRGVDHEVFIRAAWQGRQVLRDGEVVGYYYVHEGIISPAAWADRRHACALLTLACREASADGAQVLMMVPGMNHDTIRFGFDSGLRLVKFEHLFMSASFGRLEQYLPSGAPLF